MSLYFDAVTVLNGKQNQGSLRSRIYGSTELRAKPGQVYALISETAKYDTFLKEVIDNTDLLRNEPKLTPLLSLLLIHDHFFAKSGIAAPVQHPLRQAIERNKARLQSEFTRARLRRRCGSLETLKAVLLESRAHAQKTRPRWARINTIKIADTEGCLNSVSDSFQYVNMADVLVNTSKDLLVYKDDHIPHLIGLNESFDITKSHAYRNGELILQDKASCFPAFLLLGDAGRNDVGDVLDACAAPGNKTTHLAAIMKERSISGKLIACERDATRSKTLQTMAARSGAADINVFARQDFLALDPHDTRCKAVTHLLLDPSCSGSGIINRTDVPELALPSQSSNLSTDPSAHQNKRSMQPKKRKRGHEPDRGASDTVAEITENETAPDEEAQPIQATAQRLQKLSGLQTLIVEHAMKFENATRITYSTCSIHAEENEMVVARVLNSTAARARGWRVLRRHEQPRGLQRWEHRGRASKEVDEATMTEQKAILSDTELEACIRCHPDDEEGTMGFFVCGFVRDNAAPSSTLDGESKSLQHQSESGDEWEGFD